MLSVLTTPDVTIDLYRTAMQCLDRAYQEIDGLLLQSGGLCPAGVPAYTPRAPRIHPDLMALELMLPLPHMAKAAPADPALRLPETGAAYLGMRYVTEGAQLGSRMIYQHLHAAFGERLAEFGSFWTPGWIPQGGWPGVLTGLGRLESRDSLAAAARAARMTFRHMALHLAAGDSAVKAAREGEAS